MHILWPGPTLATLSLSVQIQPQFLCHLHICGHIVVAVVVVVVVVVAIVAGFYCVNLQVVLALPVCVC